MIRRFITLITIITTLLFPFQAFAVNTFTGDFETSSSQYLSIIDASQTGLDIAGDLTFEVYYKPETFTNNVRIVAKLDTNSQRAYAMELNSDGKVSLDLSDNGSSSSGHYEEFATNVAQLTQDVWTRASVTYDIDTEAAIFYINGAAVASSKITGTSIGATLHNSTAPFAIGAYFSSGVPDAFPDGLVDDVRVWNVTRTALEISANYACSLVGNETGLVAYYRLDNTVNDSTANANNLTNNNGVTFQSTDLPFTASCSGGAAPPSQESDLILYDE